MNGKQWREKLKGLSDTEIKNLVTGLGLVISVDLFRREYSDTGICIIELYAERELKNRGI